MSSPPQLSYRVLVVDDTASIHDDFRKVLAPPSPASSNLQQLAEAVFGEPALTPASAPTFQLDFAFQGEAALALVQTALAARRPYALAFVDMRMPPGWDGLETIKRLWQVDADLQVVICTAFSDHSWSAIADQLGRSANLLILKKPFDHIEVLQLAHALTEKWATHRAHRAQLDQLGETVALRTSQLASAEARFTEAFNANPLPQTLLCHDPLQILAANDAFLRQFGVRREDVPHITPETFGHGLDPTRWRALVDRVGRGEPIDEHAFVYRPAPTIERHLRCSARATLVDGLACSVWIFRDVTQQLETEQQLRQAQKLEAIGKLAAGVAHDFNNLLTVIYGYTSEVLASNSDPELRQLLEPVQTAADRAASLTRQLLIFSRKQVTQPQLIDLHAIVDELKPLLRRLIGADIDLQWEIAPFLPPLLADPASIEQVIVNLVVNARDAMPHGGRVVISAQVTTIDQATATRQLQDHAGDYLELRITDTGTGIDPDVLPRIFEPFFTTKEVGKGTGLGLSTVYSIVHQHSGWITVQSKPGVGTTFTIYHPLAPSPARDSASTSSDAPAPASPSPLPAPTPPAVFPPPPTLLEPRRNPYRLVLIAEDDLVLQRLLATILARRNLPCDVAPHGVAALELWKQKSADYDLVVTDMVMPQGVSGLRLLEQVRRDRPDIPAIIMTGYSAILAEPGVLEKIPGPRVKLLLKPFLPNDFIGALNEVAPADKKSGGSIPPFDFSAR